VVAPPGDTAAATRSRSWDSATERAATSPATSRPRTTARSSSFRS
jgi:hypothetical protein